MAEVHRKLDVSHILEGSVRKAGNEVRITLQLIDARTDSHLWSETYDRAFDDIFVIQDEISVAVADQLHLELLRSDSPHEGIDPRAYELYLRASIDPVTAGSAGTELLIAKKRLLEEALVIEPDYLPAIYGLAVAKELLGQDVLIADTPGQRQIVSDLVDRMVELDPDSVYANNWQAYIAMRWHNDLVAAAPYLEKSMRFANRTDVHVWFVGVIELLGTLGRLDEAMVVGQYWINRNPACGSCVGALAWAMRKSGHHDEAALIVESLLEWENVNSSGYWNIGVAFLVAGEPEKALHYFEQIDNGQFDKNFARAFAFYSLGRQSEFESILSHRIESRPDESAEGIARLYAWSKQPDEAFEWLEIMIAEQGETSAHLVKTDLYEPIKSDQRWQEFLEKYGAADKPNPDIPFKPQYPPALQRAVDALK